MPGWASRPSIDGGLDFREATMRRPVLSVLIIVAIVALIPAGQASGVGAIGAGSTNVAPTAPTVDATPILTGLDYPAGFTIAPDGRFFYGERFTGRIMIYNGDT